jgi:hypothetical protein
MLRPFPYPFASALAIISDVDGSSRARYDAYVGQLVGTLGLDFGDSMWLRWSCNAPAQGTPIGGGLGFFSRHFGLGRDEVAQTYLRSRTLFESLAEFHCGNVDHYHAFLSKGPRVAVLNEIEARPGLAVAAPGEFERAGFWQCGDAYADGVCVVTRGVDAPAIASVAVVDARGQSTAYERRVAIAQPDAERHQALFVVSASVEEGAAHPQFDHVARVEAKFAEVNDASRVERILLVSGSGAVMLDRLKLLRDRFNVETPLVTEHSGFHFRSATMAERRDRGQRDYVLGHEGTVAALSGTLEDEKANLIFSTDADDPRSVSRVLPELSADLEVRFLIPQAATSTSGWPLNKLISPYSTRAGTITYQAHRTFTNIIQPPPGRAFDGTQTRQENFALRVANVLAAARETPGLFWPIYTHLGGITAQTPDNNLPSPYFEVEPLHELQDRMFGISGSAAPESRVWVVRATTLYDYALLARSVSDHIWKSGADKIEIPSWRDPVLNKMLPRSPSQLFGLTFYVEDPLRAEVRLDGRLVEHLVRNKRDETGRHSVTVAECEIRYPVFKHLDPMRGDAQVEQGAWQFHAEPAFGRLTIGGEGCAKLRVPMHGWTPTGAQLLSFICRGESNAEVAIVLETETAGRFCFGHRCAVERAGKLDARYVFKDEHSEDWRRLVAPFYDMAWAESAAPGGPMPSHALAAVELHCIGKPGSHADIGDLALLRPRATSLAQDRRYCLGGAVADFRAGQEVHAAREDGSGPLSQAVDQRGRFCFTGLTKGIYRVWSRSDRGEVHDRRGALVELGGDTMYLLLNRLKA